MRLATYLILRQPSVSVGHRCCDGRALLFLLKRCASGRHCRLALAPLAFLDLVHHCRSLRLEIDVVDARLGGMR